MKLSKTPLFLAIMAALASYLLPFGRWVAYPFTLFVTLVHEGGHVIMALLTGSKVYSMAIAPDASGLTLTAPSGFVANFLAVESILNGLGDIKTVLALSVYSNAHNDARNLAELTGIPSVVWALGWGVLSVWVIASTFQAVLAKNRPL